MAEEQKGLANVALLGHAHDKVVVELDIRDEDAELVVGLPCFWKTFF